MSTSRLRPLWAPLSRNANLTPSQTATSETITRLRSPQRAGFHCPSARRRPEVSQRYGTANEPPPHLVGGKLVAPQDRIDDKRALPKPPDSKTGSTAKQGQPSQDVAKTEPATEAKASPAQQNPTGSSSAQVRSQTAQSQAEQKTAQDRGKPLSSDTQRTTQQSQDAQERQGSGTALSQILRMEPPMSEAAEEKPPHLQAPPYVHHFDTFTLVRAVHEEGGFSEEQAITLMKAVRAILADNMDLARDGIVGKGDAEMAAYLFRAACSELRTEMKNNRSSYGERMRAERTALQHEVDILGQRITADTGTLKDELKGMFDDRKMSVRMERKDVENRIQELNYKITTSLNSEMRSEVEGLRWVLVRRTAMAIVVVAFTALVVLRMNSAAQKRAESGDPKKRVAPAQQGEPDAEEPSQKPPDLLKGLEGGGDPSLISLG